MRDLSAVRRTCSDYAATAKPCGRNGGEQKFAAPARAPKQKHQSGQSRGRMDRPHAAPPTKGSYAQETEFAKSWPLHESGPSWTVQRIRAVGPISPMPCRARTAKTLGFRALLRAKVSLALWLFRVTYCFPSMQGLIQNKDNPTELLQSCIGSI